MNSWIFIVIIAVLVVFLLSRKSREAAIGICATAMHQTVLKSRNKARIVEMLTAKGELTNHEIREALGVSRQTAVNYLDELEKTGTVEQVGDTGRSVVYRRKS